MDHAQPREISVLGAEGAVQNVDIIDQFGNQALERAQVALAMPLARLVLLHVIDQDLQAAVDSAVIEVESEAADLQGLSSALVLACVGWTQDLVPEVL